MNKGLPLPVKGVATLIGRNPLYTNRLIIAGQFPAWVWRDGELISYAHNVARREQLYVFTRDVLTYLEKQGRKPRWPDEQVSPIDPEQYCGLPYPIKAVCAKTELSSQWIYDLIKETVFTAWRYTESGVHLVQHQITGTRPKVGQSIYVFENEVDQFFHGRVQEETSEFRWVEIPVLEADMILEAGRKQLAEKEYVALGQVLREVYGGNNMLHYPKVQAIAIREDWPGRSAKAWGWRTGRRKNKSL